MQSGFDDGISVINTEFFALVKRYIALQVTLIVPSGKTATAQMGTNAGILSLPIR